MANSAQVSAALLASKIGVRARVRFHRLLEQNHIITRLKHQAELEAEHLIICNYATYDLDRNIERNTHRNIFKEGIAEGLKD